MERWHEPRPGLREFRPGQATGRQTCPRKVTAVTTSAFPYNATEAQGSCPQRSGEAFPDWKRFCLLTDESVERLPPLDTSNIERVYQDVCESLLSAAKQCVPRGRRKNYVPCWYKECKTLYRSCCQAPVGTDSKRAASSLLSRLGQKKQERWEKSIDFSHSSRKARRTIKKLTDRSGRSFHHYPVSASSIASQLVKNGAHKTGDCKATRMNDKEMSALWKIPTPEGHSISEPFRPEELAAALRRLKPGKSPGLDSIFSEFILLVGSALKSWFCDFISSCMRQLKIPKIWRRALIVAIPKPEKPLGTQRVIVPYLCCVSPLKSSRDSSTVMSTQSSTYCSLGTRRVFDTGGRP